MAIDVTLSPLNPTSRFLIMRTEVHKIKLESYLFVFKYMHAVSSHLLMVCANISNHKSDNISKPRLSITILYETYTLINQSINISCLSPAAGSYFTQKQQIMSEMSFTTLV